MIDVFQPLWLQSLFFNKFNSIQVISTIQQQGYFEKKDFSKKTANTRQSQ